MFTLENTKDATHFGVAGPLSVPYFYKGINNDGYLHLGNTMYEGDWNHNPGDPVSPTLINLSRPVGQRKEDFEQAHHIALQIEALGPIGSPVEFVESETGYLLNGGSNEQRLKESIAQLNNDQWQALVIARENPPKPSKELIGLLHKEVIDGVHIDADGDLSVGSEKVGVASSVNLKYHDIDEDGKITPAFTQPMVNMKLSPDEGMECIIHFCNASYRSRITYQGDEVGCFIHLKDGKEYSYATSAVTFGAIDTRTDEEKAVDEVAEFLSNENGGDCKSMAKSDIDIYIKCVSES